MKGKQATPNNLLKKLYAFTQSKQKAFKRIIPVHKNIFRALQHGEFKVQNKRQQIQAQLAEYKNENRLKMDQQTMASCISIYNIFLGKEAQEQKINLKQKKLLQRKEQREISKQKSSLSLNQKEKQYQSKIKQYQKQKEKTQQLKKIQELKRLQAFRLEQEKRQRQKFEKQEKQKELRRQKLEIGLKQIEQRRKKRQQMVKQMSLSKMRSQSMKTLGKNSVPKYIQLEKKYLQKQRKKAQQIKQLQKQKKQSMHLDYDQIKKHQKQYIQRIKQSLNLKSIQNSSQFEVKSRKAKSDFNLISHRQEQEQERYRVKAHRRKQFQNRLRNIPIRIDSYKKRQKLIQVDKLTNKQKYILLSSRHLDDDQIYSEFQDFQKHVDPKQLGRNYLNQLKQIPKSSRIINKNQQTSLAPENSQKITYINYLQELKNKNQAKPKQNFIIEEQDELLKLVQKSKRMLKRNLHQQQNNDIAIKQRVSLTQSKLPRKQDVPAKVREKELKASVSKSITEKISQYQQKVFKKVNDLKKISQYDDSIKYQNQIDDLCSKVLRAKIDTIDLS